MICDDARFIFVHVQKTGGTSIRRTLRGQFGQWTEVPIHSTVIRVRALHPEKFSAYWTFGFVRNPWDQWVSWWFAHQKMRQRFGEFHKFIEAQPWKWFGFRSCWHRLCDRDGSIIVDTIYRFESLQAAWRDICKRLKINTPLPHLNRRNHPPYREMYDNTTRKLVARGAKGDIERWGYTF